jgi:hypothetical protein
VAAIYQNNRLRTSKQCTKSNTIPTILESLIRALTKFYSYIYQKAGCTIKTSTKIGIVMTLAQRLEARKEKRERMRESATTEEIQPRNNGETLNI